MWTIVFMKYLPPVISKMVPKLKMFRIYWNLAHLIFQICQSQFWCGKWFLLNIYHLLGWNWSQSQKYAEFIGIFHIWYFKYADLEFNLKNDFLSNTDQLLGPNWSHKEKHSKFIENWLNRYFKDADLYFDVKLHFY